MQRETLKLLVGRHLGSCLFEGLTGTENVALARRKVKIDGASLFDRLDVAPCEVRCVSGVLNLLILSTLEGEQLF